MCEIISEIQTKDMETLKNEILEHTKQQMAESDIKKLQFMRVKQLNPESAEAQRFLKNEAQRQYRVKNRESISEKRKRARLENQKLLMEARKIIENS